MREPRNASGGYEVSLEVAGPLAMFARPDTGATPTSYPVPTWSATKGLFESIAFFRDGSAWICPTRVDVCRRIGDPGGRVRFQRYTTNYGGPHRKKDQIKGSSGNRVGEFMSPPAVRPDRDPARRSGSRWRGGSAHGCGSRRPGA